MCTMVVVGAGVMNPLPGAAWAALPGTCAVGRLPRWQVSQLVDVGRWLVLAADADGGITTIVLIPWNVPAAMDCPWHSAQPEVMPLWLKAELAKVGVPLNGMDVTLDADPTWQLSQPSPCMGTCVLPGLTIGLVAPVLYVVAFGSLWHCAQLVAPDGR